jgi:hypothetical protein
MVGLHLSHKETKNNSNDNDYKSNNPVSSPILQKEASIDDGNSKRFFECGCTVEWHLAKKNLLIVLHIQIKEKK